MEYFEQIVNTIINNFDFTYCLIVNLLTYSVIKLIDMLNGEKEVKSIIKKLVLFICILLTGVVYYTLDVDIKIIINSAILAPVAWSWIFKPICKKLGIDYRRIDKTINN